MTREDHLSHIEQVTADLAKNQKPFWNWMKHIKGCHQDIPDRIQQPRKSRGSYFSSIYTKDDVHSTTIPYSIQDQHSVQETYKLLSKMDARKSKGPDNIPGVLLKEGASQLAGPLTKLFNLSFQLGKIPTDWKSANVTPIFKKGNKHETCNYRPISLTSIVVKTLVHKRLSHFLEVNNKLNPTQHGFTQSQLLETNGPVPWTPATPLTPFF